MSNLGIRLVLPRVRFLVDLYEVHISTHGFGKKWGNIERPANFCSYDLERPLDLTMLPQIFSRNAEVIQCHGSVEQQLMYCANNYKKCAEIYGGPKVGSIFKTSDVAIESAIGWPDTMMWLQSGFSIEANIQITTRYLQRFDGIIVIEVENANKMHPEGPWIINGQFARHPNISDYTFVDNHSSNVINGYYVDWELYGWNKLKVT